MRTRWMTKVVVGLVVALAAAVVPMSTSALAQALEVPATVGDYVTCPDASFVGPYETADEELVCYPRAAVPAGDIGTFVGVEIIPATPTIQRSCPAGTIRLTTDPVTCARDTTVFVTRAADVGADGVPFCADDGEPVELVIRDGFATCEGAYSQSRPVSPNEVEVGECPDGYHGPFTGQSNNDLFDSFASLLYFEPPGDQSPTCELASAEHLCLGRVVTVNLGRGEMPTDDGDVILGTMRADTINLGSGDNIVCALGGNDVIVGGAGNDYILAGGGHDNIRGGAGDDIISGQPGADTIRGGDDRDIVFGGSGYDRLEGGDGNDLLSGAGGNDTLNGGAGDDLLYGRYGDDRLAGGIGDDEIFGAGGDDWIDGGAGDDHINAGSGSDEIFGDVGADSIYGKDGDDTLDGGAGDDGLFGGGDDDVLRGDEGNDYLHGGSGNDGLSGSFGNDTLFGGPGADALDGGPGNNVCGISTADASIVNC